jgi:peroxiredoxin
MRRLPGLGLSAALLLAGCSGTSRPAAPEPQPEKAVARRAPDFTLTDYSGETHTLSDYTAQGKIVVLEWFDSACGAVNAYYSKPEFVEQVNAGLNGGNVVWLSVNSAGEGKPGFGSAENIKYAAEHSKTNPILEDAAGTVGHAYGAKATPTVIVVAPDGRVSYFGKFDEAKNPGEAVTGTNLVLAAVESVSAGQPVAVEKTEPFG